MLSSQRHPLLARSPPDKTLSLALSGNPLQLTPFPSELLPAGILWQPRQGFPYPEGSISPPLTPACFKGSGPVLCSQRQGWCLGQDVGRWVGRNSPSAPWNAANHLLIVLNEKQIPWQYCSPGPHPGKHSLSNWDRIREIKGEFDFPFFPKLWRAQTRLLTHAVTPLFKWQVKAPGFSSHGCLKVPQCLILINMSFANVAGRNVLFPVLSLAADV